MSQTETANTSFSSSIQLPGSKRVSNFEIDQSSYKRMKLSQSSSAMLFSDCKYSVGAKNAEIPTSSPS